MRFIVLDTETTGFNRGEVSRTHRIIEIACIEIIDGVITGKEFHAFVDPGRLISKKAVEIHGITNSFIKGKRRFEDVASQFFTFIADSIIVIHNAAFDISFLNKEFNLLPNRLKPYGSRFEFIDTLIIARALFPGADNSLDGLALRFQITGRDGVHSALSDARILARVWLLLLAYRQG